jgi:hypothetical protein
MKLIYTVELKDWDNQDNYPVIYNGSNLILAMTAFKEAHLNNQDVIMYTDDTEGNNLDILENYNLLSNIIKCNDFFKPENKELAKRNREALQQKEIYNQMYIEQLNANNELKKQIERLQAENRQLKQQFNKAI